ncbi:MAG: phosphoribosylanthranilate isomerase [Armatimonadetes bacterium]|nr:phosphoribosylanthranilate isomerase [Armatimonadota bacterium]
MRTRVKVCGITNLEDAIAACELGVDAVGFVFAESARQVTLEEAAEIADQLPPFVKTVGVFTAENPRVSAIADWVPLDLIQLHGDQTEQFAEWIGGARVVRAVRIRDESSLKWLKKWEHSVAYVLDTWVAKQPGGTGKTFDWSLAVRAKEFGKPVILAGGLSPENVVEAIRTVRPYGVDVSSGVESFRGKKDHKKMKEFIANVRAADETA